MPIWGMSLSIHQAALCLAWGIHLTPEVPRPVLGDSFRMPFFPDKEGGWLCVAPVKCVFASGLFSQPLGLGAGIVASQSRSGPCTAPWAVCPEGWAFLLQPHLSSLPIPAFLLQSRVPIQRCVCVVC